MRKLDKFLDVERSESGHVPIQYLSMRERVGWYINQGKTLMIPFLKIKNMLLLIKVGVVYQSRKNFNDPIFEN